MTDYEIERQKQQALAKQISERLREMREHREDIPVVESGSSFGYAWTRLPVSAPISRKTK